jgi:hypothetical protein
MMAKHRAEGDPMEDDHSDGFKHSPQDWGGLAIVILAGAFGVGLLCFCVGVLYDAIYSKESSGLSSNATQILTAWGGGVIGVLGGYVGYRTGRQALSDSTNQAVSAPEEAGGYGSTPTAGKSPSQAQAAYEEGNPPGVAG